MNKKILKYSFLASCSLCSASLITTTAISLSHKKTSDIPQHKTYNAKKVTNQIVDQLEIIGSEVVNLISAESEFSQETKFYVNYVYDLFSQTFISTLRNVALECKDFNKNKDPLELFQEVLFLFHDEVMEGVYNFASNDVIKHLFSEEKINNFVNLMNGIVTKRIDLKKYAKSNWSLQDLFENVLYPLFGDDEQAKEKAWELIFSVYSDNYYTGLNFNHSNGEKINGTYELLDKPTYTNKFSWENISRGDVVFSARGFGLYGHYSGHCAIVDGWYDAKVKGSNDTVKYLRVIEANQFGVSYGLLDDIRMFDDKISVLHISDANIRQIEAAAEFCDSQLGKNYNIPLFLSEDVSKNTSAWYCSELIWAAYMNQGIDIQSNEYFQGDIPGILPWEILYYKNAKVITSWNFVK